MRRGLIIAVAVLIALIAAGAIGVRYLLSPEMLRAAIEQQGSAWLGRPVSVAHARARLLPSPGVTLTGVQVGGPMAIAADRVVVGASLGGLLQKRVEDAVLRVSGGRITLARDTEPGPVEPPRREGPAGEEAGGFTVASVSRIELDDVTLVGNGRELNIDLTGALKGDRLEIRALSLRSGDTSLDATGELTSVSPVTGNLSIDSPLFNAEEVLALVDALLPAQAPAGAVPAGGAGPAIGRITAEIAVEKGRALGYEIGNLKATVVLKGTVLRADPLTFDLYGGRYDSSLDLSLGEATSLSHRAQVAGTSVASLAALFGHEGAATGSLSMRLNVQGQGAEFGGAAEHARGTAEVQLTDGTIAGLDVVRSTFVVMGVSPPERGHGERYESITARIAVADGVLRADDFVMRSPDFDLTGEVTVDPAGRLAGEADLVLSEALSAEAQHKNKDLKLTFEDRRITVPATIGGTLASPRVLPDLAEALARAARNRVRSELDKAKEKAGQEIRKGLERLFPKPR